MEELNEGSGVPLYRQVAARVREAIQRGDLVAGNRLPPAEELGATYGVGRVTALRAIGDLQAEGFVITKRGQGTFVRGAPEYVRLGSDRYTRTDPGASPTFTEGRFAGWRPSLQADVSTTIADDKLAERLGISKGDPVSVVHYRWLSEHDEQPVQVSTQWEPLALTQGTEIERPPASGQPDVITRFDSIGLRADRVEEETRTRMPTQHETTELMIGSGIPVFTIQRTHWAGSLALETADITIRGDRMAIVTSHHVEGA